MEQVFFGKRNENEYRKDRNFNCKSIRGRDIIIEGREVKNTECFKYLGSIFSKEGGNKRDISERIRKFSMTVGALYPIIKDQHVTLEAKKVIFNTVLTRILIYGSESWVLTTADRSRIQAAEMRPLRTMVGKTRRDRVRNIEVREEVGVCPILNRIDAAHLRWLGYLERMDEERMARGCWQWRPDGRRPRIKPRKRWKEAVEETLESHNLPNIETLGEERVFQDRSGWRGMVARLTGT